MKIDRIGRSPAAPTHAPDAEARIHNRLRQRFEVALAAAESDYPVLERTRPTRSSGHSLVSSRPRRLAAVVAGMGVIVVLLAGALAIVARPAEISGPATSSTQAAITLPPRIDDQRIYTIAELGRRADTSGSFLVRGYARQMTVPCPTRLGTPAMWLESDLVPECGTISLVPAPSDNTIIYFNLAPRTRDLLLPWIDGPEIVIRVHAHDAEAAKCSEQFRTQCENALVIEAVVLPAPSSATPGPAGAGMAATGSAGLRNGDVVAWLTITNNTGQDDAVTEVDSFAASTGMVGFPACSAVPSGRPAPCGTPWLVRMTPVLAGRSSSVAIIVSGFAAAPQNGDNLELTLHFTHADPLTVKLTIRADAGPSAASSGA